MRKILAGLFFTASVFATPMPADRVENVEHFLHWAESLSGYSAGGKVPLVYLMSETAIDKLYCGSGALMTADCGISGMYRAGVLYVNRDMDPRQIESTIVHELTHYLQDLNGKYTDRCRIEFEANRVEWAYSAVVYATPGDFHFNREWYKC